MANICTNILFCSTENTENYKKVMEFIEENFNVDFIEEEKEDNSTFFEGEFDSKWSFPEQEFNELIKLITDDNDLYIRILSHELSCEYASFRIYQNKKWNIRF